MEDSSSSLNPPPFGGLLQLLLGKDYSAPEEEIKFLCRKFLRQNLEKLESIISRMKSDFFEMNGIDETEQLKKIKRNVPPSYSEKQKNEQENKLKLALLSEYMKRKNLQESDQQTKKEHLCLLISKYISMFKKAIQKHKNDPAVLISLARLALVLPQDVLQAIILFLDQDSLRAITLVHLPFKEYATDVLIRKEGREYLRYFIFHRTVLAGEKWQFHILPSNVIKMTGRERRKISGLPWNGKDLTHSLFSMSFDWEARLYLPQTGSRSRLTPRFFERDDPKFDLEGMKYPFFVNEAVPLGKSKTEAAPPLSEKDLFLLNQRKFQSHLSSKQYVQYNFGLTTDTAITNWQPQATGCLTAKIVFDPYAIGDFFLSTDTVAFIKSTLLNIKSEFEQKDTVKWIEDQKTKRVTLTFLVGFTYDRQDVDEGTVFLFSKLLTIADHLKIKQDCNLILLSQNYNPSPSLLQQDPTPYTFSDILKDGCIKLPLELNKLPVSPKRIYPDDLLWLDYMKNCITDSKFLFTEIFSEIRTDDVPNYPLSRDLNSDEYRKNIFDTQKMRVGTQVRGVSFTVICCEVSTWIRHGDLLGTYARSNPVAISPSVTPGGGIEIQSYFDAVLAKLEDIRIKIPRITLDTDAPMPPPTSFEQQQQTDDFRSAVKNVFFTRIHNPISLTAGKGYGKSILIPRLAKAMLENPKLENNMFYIPPDLFGIDAYIEQLRLMYAYWAMMKLSVPSSDKETSTVIDHRDILVHPHIRFF